MKTNKKLDIKVGTQEEPTKEPAEDYQVISFFFLFAFNNYKTGELIKINILGFFSHCLKLKPLSIIENSVQSAKKAEV